MHFYADDIILLSATVHGLQQMLDVSHNYLSELQLSFNYNKSVCVHFDCGWRRDITNMNLGSSLIGWTSSIKYLRINNLSGPRFKVDTDSIKRRFYGSCNTILNRSVNQSELLRLSLTESYSLPVLQYSFGSKNLNEYQLIDFNICWNSAYRRIFGIHQWESVRKFLVRQKSIPLTSIELRCMRLAESVHGGTIWSTTVPHRKCQRTVEVGRQVYHGRHSRTWHSGLKDAAVWHYGGLQRRKCQTGRAGVRSPWNDDVCTPTGDVAVGRSPVDTWQTAEQQFALWPSTERISWTPVCSFWWFYCRLCSLVSYVSLLWLL